MLDIVKAVERLSEIRDLKRKLEEEERKLRQELQPIIEAAGGRITAAGYVLSLSPVETYQYGKIVEVLKNRHPELEDELAQISQQFKTQYSKLLIERLS
jgi:F0F1-type ATP synthase membrane subunit b/b'